MSANVYVPIHTTTLGSNTAATSVSINNIPSTDPSNGDPLKDLVFTFSWPGTTGDQYIWALYSGDAIGSNSNYDVIYGNASFYSGTPVVGKSNNGDRHGLNPPYGAHDSLSQIYIYDYTSTTKWKSILQTVSTSENSLSVQMFGGCWKSLSTISSISFAISGSGTFLAGTTFSLYGVKE